MTPVEAMHGAALLCEAVNGKVSPFDTRGTVYKEHCIALKAQLSRQFRYGYLVEAHLTLVHLNLVQGDHSTLADSMRLLGRRSLAARLYSIERQHAALRRALQVRRRYAEAQILPCLDGRPTLRGASCILYPTCMYLAYTFDF